MRFIFLVLILSGEVFGNCKPFYSMKCMLIYYCLSHQQQCTYHSLKLIANSGLDSKAKEYYLFLMGKNLQTSKIKNLLCIPMTFLRGRRMSVHPAIFPGSVLFFMHTIVRGHWEQRRSLERHSHHSYQLTHEEVPPVVTFTRHFRKNSRWHTQQML